MSKRFAAQPGWYADPDRRAPRRWFDGFRWTDMKQPPAALGTQGAPVDTEAWTQPTVGPESVAPSQLASLLGDASRFAVMDVETTGLRASDRVVEITVLTLDHSGTVTKTFDTVVNPLRDVGPTWIHGLTAVDVADAPTFGEIAHAVAELLDDAIVVAHNRPFDTRMVGSELERSGIDVRWGSGLDTLAVTRCKLGVACYEHGVQHRNQHRALGDARATADLLRAVAGRFTEQGTPTSVTRYRQTHSVRIRARNGEAIAERLPFLADISQGLHTATDIAPEQ